MKAQADPAARLPAMKISPKMKKRTLTEWPDSDLVRAFLSAPLEDLAELTTHGKIPRPRFNLKIGRHDADAYLESFYAGYVGTVLVRSFLFLLRKEGDKKWWPKVEEWTYNGSSWKIQGIRAFNAYPEIGRTVRYMCERGESVYHIRSYLWALRKIWMELDGKRPSRWTLEEVLHLLSNRWVSGRGSVQYPLCALAALWNRERKESNIARTSSRFRRLFREAIRDIVRTAAKQTGYRITRPKTAAEKARDRELARMGHKTGGGYGRGGGGRRAGGGGPRRNGGGRPRSRPNARQRARHQARITMY